MNRSLRRLALGAAATVALGGVAASTSIPVAASADELDEVRQTYIGFANEINWVWAQEHDIFEEHGIDFEPVQTGGGAAGVAAVMSGSADIGFVGGTDAIKAFQQGFPIRIVGAAYGNVNPPQPNGRGVVVAPDSGIESPCDLVGRKVAIDEVGGIGHIYMAAWIADDGCDPNEVDFIALPNGQLDTAFLSGRVDAVGLNATRAQAIVSSGDGVLLLDPMGVVAGDVAYAVYITTADYLAAHEEVLVRWRAALDESLAQITDPANEDAVFELMAEHGGTTVELLRSIANEPQITTVDHDVLAGMVDTMVAGGFLPEPVDVDELLAPLAMP
ncbi:ABC transporter substrate-binding protein [Desertimonas flava]|uniref:ABC transporter substrate-binding protein n=1 Tax=Desertimonas flava TaxID=2064846 RepID=UPI000E34E531|nr:ABC transporter substrate-binding protein [Desertimonas flava]